MGTTIGERIKEAREAKGWKPADLARALKLSAASISQLESGKSGAPSADTLLKMRDKGLNPDYIMRAKGPRLLDDIEQRLKDDTLFSMIGEMTAEQKDMLSDVARGIIRRKKQPSPNDPYKADPPDE
jgi:transcriptional regulator with XRE-family HTH domain